MNEDLQNIDDLFRKALDENQELPAGSVWENIDKALDKRRIISIAKKYSKLKWAVAALLIFSLGMALYILHIRHQNNELVKEDRKVKSELKQKAQNKIPANDSLISATDKAITSTVSKGNNSAAQKQINNVDKSVSKNDLTVLDNKNRRNKASDKETAVNKNMNVDQSSGKENESLALQRRKKPTAKNMASLKMQAQAGAIDLVNTNTEKENQSAINYSKNEVAESTITNNSVYTIVAERQKNIETNALVPELKSDVLLPIQYPTFQNYKELQTKSIALNKNVSVYRKSKVNFTNNSRFSATVFFSPDIVSTALKNDHPNFREEEKSEIKKDERTKFSYTSGVLLDYHIGKKWQLQSGLTYSIKKTNIRPKTIYARPDNDGNINYRFNCSAGYSYVTVKSAMPPVAGDSVNALASNNNLEYIGIPLAVKYIVSAGRFSLLPGAGISFNFLTKGKIKTTVTSYTGSKIPSADKIQGLKSMYMNATSSLGVQYKMSKMFAISFEPTFRFSISSINKDASVKTNLNSIGLNTGLIFRL